MIDFHKKELPVGPPVAMKIAREDLVKQIQDHGIALVEEHTFLPYQYFLVFLQKQDQCTMFVNIQHPGESTTHWNNLNGTNNPGATTTANPSTVSSWPFCPGFRPRPATVVIRKLDGGKIGS
jgi:hypothetical protein